MGAQYLVDEQINVCGVDTEIKARRGMAQLCFFTCLRRRLRGNSTGSGLREAIGNVLGRKPEFRKLKRKPVC